SDRIRSHPARTDDGVYRAAGNPDAVRLEERMRVGRLLARVPERDVVRAGVDRRVVGALAEPDVGKEDRLAGLSGDVPTRHFRPKVPEAHGGLACGLRGTARIRADAGVGVLAGDDQRVVGPCVQRLLRLDNVRGRAEGPGHEIMAARRDLEVRGEALV